MKRQKTSLLILVSIAILLVGYLYIKSGNTFIPVKTAELMSNQPSDLSERPINATASRGSVGGPKDLPKIDLIDSALSDQEMYVQIAIAADLCDIQRDPEDSSSVMSMIRQFEEEGNVALAQSAESFVKYICTEGNVNALSEAVSYQAYDSPSRHIFENSVVLKESADFVSLIHESSEDGKVVASNTAISEFTVDSIKGVHGLFELIELSRIMDEAGLWSIGLADYGYPRYVTGELSSAGATLASCRIFGGCDRNSVFAISSCMFKCNQPMSIEELMRYLYPQTELETIEAAATAIIRARTSGSYRPEP